MLNYCSSMKGGGKWQEGKGRGGEIWFASKLLPSRESREKREENGDLTCAFAEGEGEEGGNQSTGKKGWGGLKMDSNA